MRKSLLLALVVGLQLSIVGCAVVSERITGRNSDRNQVESLLAYYHRLNVSTLDVQRAEHLEAIAANDRAPDDATRLRLALTLLLPGTPWRDDTRAGQLLGAVDVSTSSSSSPRHDFVVLIEKMLQLRREEQRKCDQKVDALRDERRRLEQRLDGAREECKKAEVLQQKLDELRDIDRDMRGKRPLRRAKP
jgi:hypothetical protein